MRAQDAAPQSDTLFRHTMTQEVSASISARVAQELHRVADPKKYHLIPEAVKLTLTVNQAKNRTWLKPESYEDGYQYLRYASALRNLLQEMEVPIMLDIDNLAGSLCAGAERCMEEYLDALKPECLWPC